MICGEPKIRWNDGRLDWNNCSEWVFITDTISLNSSEFACMQIGFGKPAQKSKKKEWVFITSIYSVQKLPFNYDQITIGLKNLIWIIHWIGETTIYLFRNKLHFPVDDTHKRLWFNCLPNSIFFIFLSGCHLSLPFTSGRALVGQYRSGQESLGCS